MITHETQLLMKKPILLIMICALGAACTPDEGQWEIPATPLTHTVEFQVQQSRSYADAVFDSVKAELNLSIAVESPEGPTRVIWDTIFTKRSIRAFPENTSPLVIRRQINILERPQAVLRLSHSIQYQDRNNIRWMSAKGETVPRNMSLVRVDVKL